MNKTQKLASDYIMLGSAVFFAILAVEFMGMITLKIFHHPLHSFFYNLVFGFGIFTLVACFIAIIEEFKEHSKGDKNAK